MNDKLINKDSYAFIEGATAADLLALAADVGDISTDLGNHKNNSTAHLTANEKAYLQSPFVVGSYFGEYYPSSSESDTGKVVNVGFRPAAVFVIDTTQYPVDFGSYDTIENNFGFTVDGLYDAKCLEITDTGFKAYSINASSTTNKARSVLNRVGNNYIYIAFRAAPQ